MKPEFKGYYEAFGLKVAFFRKRKRLTQVQLADLVGVDRSHISALEVGKVSFDRFNSSANADVLMTSSLLSIRYSHTFRRFIQLMLFSSLL